ncbi:MAG: DUF3105 domain-containing protein, partial [Chloroflexi bacterium]|nr:DUF3105 domain-containing protein [Chloroflexota bacterium]
VAAALLAVGILGALFAMIPRDTRPQPGRVVADEGGGHVDEGSVITYKNNPPASGPHYPRWADYGVYEQTVPTGTWVHNLEHGAIVVLYRCPAAPASCSDVVGQLKAFYQQAPNGKYGKVKMVAAPYPELATPFAALAWNRIDELETFDMARLLTFYKAYVDRGPEDVP